MTIRGVAAKRLLVTFFNEMLQHIRGYGKFSNNAVLHGADGFDAARRAAEHFFASVPTAKTERCPVSG